MMNKETRTSCIVLAVLLGSAALSGQTAALEVHRQITGPFAAISDVTKSCLECHRPQAAAVLQSTHWTWVRQHNVNGGNTLSGKKNSLTGFAIDVASNPSRCMGCHVGSARPAVDIDAPAPEMVDCLVCHDTTGVYRQTGQGVPGDHTQGELEQMARNVGSPSPANCKKCHFADCGLPAVDPQSRAARPDNVTEMPDIHMDRAAAPFTCQDCHPQNSGHGLSGKIQSVDNHSSAEQGCAACHGDAPHAIDQLNHHVAAISCQTCHIPQYAQKDPMVLSWNWLMTGRTNRLYQNRPHGRPLVRDENGFTSATQLEPVYLWDDGEDMTYTRGQRIRPQELTYLRRPSERSPASKIAPFRVIYGTQLYDTKYRYLISPLLQPTGSSLFPGSNWDTVARQGMQALVLPYSGQYAFAPTAALRRINHGVVAGDKALGCLDCHGSTSRMDWKELGYDQDPWSGIAPVNKENEDLGRDSDQVPATPLQPVKESVIPPGFSF
jgi:octaheme c-type cytochrome (tetrathionate reductase family)